MQLSTIGRCEYEKTCTLLISLFDQAASNYQELLNNTNSVRNDVSIQEGSSNTVKSLILLSECFWRNMSKLKKSQNALAIMLELP